MTEPFRAHLEKRYLHELPGLLSLWVFWPSGITVTGLAFEAKLRSGCGTYRRLSSCDALPAFPLLCICKAGSTKRLSTSSFPWPGCMAERLKGRLLETEKLVDLVAGPDAYRDLPRLIDAVQVCRPASVVGCWPACACASLERRLARQAAVSSACPSWLIAPFAAADVMSCSDDHRCCTCQICCSLKAELCCRWRAELCILPKGKFW